MRIAVVAPSLDIVGGQSIQADALCAGLRRAGYEVDFVPVNPRFPRGLGWVRSLPYARTALNQALYFPSLHRLRQADVVHVFSASYWSFLIAVAPALLAARRFGKRILLNYHSGEAEDHLERWGALVHPWLALANEIVVPSEYLRAVFARHGYPARAVPNLVDTTRFRYRDRMPPRARFLSARNLEPYYRVDVTLEAFAMVRERLPSATLTIAGDGSERGRLVRQAAELGEHGIRFVGRVNPIEMPKHYEAADVFVNASVVDNQPLSVLEAFAAGLPVVSTATGDIGALVRDGETGLVVPANDPASMAKALTVVLEYPVRALRMARQARSEVEAFTWERLRDQWAAAYAGGAGMIRRLARTGTDELICRGRQEAAKRLERAGVVARPGLGADHPLSLERFRAFSARHFFDGAVSERTASLLIDRMPAARDEAVKIADDACGGRFDLLGYEGLSFGDPIDWSLDPLSGRRAPRDHWSRLDPLDPQTVGDSKVVWELNRHQWMVQLGQAYRLTGELRYARTFNDCIARWIDANPAGVGINWASSLEVSFRLIAWCWALLLLRGSPVLSPALFDRIVRSIWAHAAHVEQYLSYYFSPNTHLTGEALGLVYAGLVFPELPCADRWRALGTRILVEQSARHILDDGVYFELSTGYQRYTLEFYLHLLILAERNEWPIPAAVAARVERMVDFLVAVRCPDGSMPQIGDADGGTLVPLARRPQDDCRGVLATAAALFGRADCAWAAGPAAPEVLWLLGPAGLDAFDALRPAPPAGPSSRLFADGGYAIMRSGWAPDDHHMIFDVGALGCPVSGGHGHADLLSVQCAVFGEPYLVDSGTYCYAGDPEGRRYFRSTAAHSAVVVDGESQAIPGGPFRWVARPGASLLDWRSTPELDFAEAHHRAYVELPGGGVVHRRRVAFVKGSYWVIVDDLEGDGEHHVDLQFQFAPLEVQVDPALWARARGRSGTELLVRPFASVALKASVHTGELDPLRGWVSPIYGRREPAPLLVYSTVTTLPLRVLTLLLPSAGPRAAAPSVSPVIDASGAPVGLVLDDAGERIAFGERGLPEIWTDQWA